jgi:hypothetical protein
MRRKTLTVEKKIDLRQSGERTPETPRPVVAFHGKGMSRPLNTKLEVVRGLLGGGMEPDCGMRLMPCLYVSAAIGMGRLNGSMVGYRFVEPPWNGGCARRDYCYIHHYILHSVIRPFPFILHIPSTSSFSPPRNFRYRSGVQDSICSILVPPRTPSRRSKIPVIRTNH